MTEAVAAMDRGAYVWIDVDLSRAEEAKALLAGLGLCAPEIVEDALTRDDAIQLARYDDYLHLVLTGCRLNGKAFDQYFPTALQRMIVTEALRVVDAEEAYDVDATLHGGGVTGQAGALRMAIARSLVELDPEARPALKKAGLLTRDPRRKESKKYGLVKARKAKQYTKR